MPSHCRMRVFDRDLIRGGHYGQRSCEPFRGIFEVSEQCPNMPLSICPCVSFVARNVLAVTGLFHPFRRSRGLAVDSWIQNHGLFSIGWRARVTPITSYSAWGVINRRRTVRAAVPALGQ